MISKLILGSNKPVKARVISVVLFVALLIPSVFSTWNFHDYIHHKPWSRFNQLSDELIARTERSMVRLEGLIQGLRGFFNASDLVTRDEFRIYLRALDLSNFPGVLSCGYLKRVSEEEKQAVIEKVRVEDGAEDVFLKNFSIRSNRIKKEYFPVFFIEPREGRQALLGLDMSEISERWEVMQLARDTGQVTATAPLLTLVKQEKDAPSLGMGAAIYQSNMPLNTVADRRNALVGYVAVGLRVSKMLEEIMISANDKEEISFEVFDGNEPRPENILFRRGVVQTEKHGWLYREKLIDMVGRPWLIRIGAPPSFGLNRFEQILPVFIFGIEFLFSLMLAGFVYLLMTRGLRAEERAQEMLESLQFAELDKLKEQAKAHAADEAGRQLEKKVAERTATLEASNKKLYLQSQILNAASNGIVITDTDGNIIWANKAVSKLTGYSLEELSGKNPRVLKSGKHDQAFYEKLWKTVLSGEVWLGEVTNRRKDGTFYNERMTITPVKDETGKIMNFVAIKEDVTAQKNLEEQFRQSQKMEVIGQLAGGVAHDFNNLLTVINGYCELLELQVKPEDKIYSKILTIKRAGQRAAVLTAQLLSIGRRNLVNAVLFDLNQTILDSEQILSRLLPSNMTLKFECDTEIGLIHADESQINQVLLNLVVNARDAMLPDGGTIKIQTSSAAVGSTEAAQYPGMRTGEYVLLAVSDTGCGMTEEVKKRIFEPFFTTKAKGKGTGLGLPTCYGIMKQHGGYIRVESEAGRGTTFFAYLPKANLSKEKLESIKKEKEARVAGGTETILVVEDEDGVRNLVTTALKAKGYQVIEANNGEVARDLINQKKHFDLILTDIMMPVMDGKKLYEFVKKDFPSAKFIFMSGYAADAPFRKEIDEQRLPFIQKPFRIDFLMTKIRQILDGREED